MTEHIPNELLNRFTDGDLGETEAVDIAHHLDACTHCSTRALALEPLTSAFASCDEPVMPVDLPLSILAELAHKGPTPKMEVAIGASLLAMAAGLAIATQHPVTLLADVGAVASASHALVRSVSAGIGPFAMVATVAMIAAGLGGLLTVRTARANRRAL